MSVEENLRLLDAAIDAYNAHDLNGYVKLHAESIMHTRPGLSDPLKGRAALLHDEETFNQAFPDVHIWKEKSFGQGEWVCVEGTFTATHTAPMVAPGGRTVPATNKPIRLRFSFVAKVERSELTETHAYFDMLEVMSQLGLIS